MSVGYYSYISTSTLEFFQPMQNCILENVFLDL